MCSISFSVILVIFVHFFFQASVSVHWGQNVARREPRFEFHYPLLSFIVNVGYSLCFYRHCWDFDIYITKWTILKLLPSSHQDFGIYKWSRSLTSLLAKLRSSTLPHRHNQNHRNYCHFLTINKSHPQVEEHNIVVYVNATPYCTTIELEHHRGPCRWWGLYWA